MTLPPFLVVLPLRQRFPWQTGLDTTWLKMDGEQCLGPEMTPNFG